MSTHPISDQMIDRNWHEFMRAVLRRLEDGANEYGDQSFKRPVPALVSELEQELLDVCGWAFIAYCRLRARLNPSD